MMYLAVREDDIGKAESLVARVGKDYGDSVMFAVAHRDTVMVARLRGEARSAHSIGEVSGAADQVGRCLLELPTPAAHSGQPHSSRPPPWHRTTCRSSDRSGPRSGRTWRSQPAARPTR